MTTQVPSERTLNLIGRAVINAQLLEVAIAPIYEAVLLKVDPARHAKTNGKVTEQLMRSATENMIKELEKRSSIAPELAARLRTFVNDRHILIHRWVAQNGLGNTEVADLRLAAHAIRVANEAQALCLMLTSFMVRHSRAPDASERIRRTFLEAHIDGSALGDPRLASGSGNLPPMPLHASVWEDSPGSD